MQDGEWNQTGSVHTDDRQPEFTTKNEWVYARMRKDILCGALTPGQRLVVSRLARLYNVSPMPVRDALNRLAQDGFVDIAPHAGATVVSLNGQQLHEIVSIRMELEALAAGLATVLVGPDDFAFLDALHLQMQHCAEEEDRMRYESLNWSFHDYVYARCGNATLYEMVMSLWRKSSITRMALIRIPAKLHHSVAGHRLCLEQMRAKDVEAVRVTMREHVRNTLEQLAQFAHTEGTTGFF